MRAGSCAVQQALTSEAAAVVKQAVTLAKQRGHAQVTPLHVATTMLAASGGLIRVACLQSHSHPLQCKALDLCFNVALNRLPASSSSSSSPSPRRQDQPPHYPSISNALVAAFKRAQANQRRGTVENQPQPALLAVRIELEQLIISILDDPSVSRVMREAGFSSTQVKSNVEKVVSAAPSTNKYSKDNTQPPTTLTSNVFSMWDNTRSKHHREDVDLIIDGLLASKKRKSIVVVGECISNVESSVKGLMDRVEKGRVPDSLKEVKFITFPPFFSFCNLQREEVEQKIAELSNLVRNLIPKGVVLYLGDMKWISDYKINLQQERSYYCSVQHVITELGKLASRMEETKGRFWLMGIATFQIYMRSRSGSSSLEALWGLNPVTIPANGLGLSLTPERDEQVESKQGSSHWCSQLLRVSSSEEVSPNLNTEQSMKFEEQALNLRANDATLSSLPPWLRNESKRLRCNNNQAVPDKGDFRPLTVSTVSSSSSSHDTTDIQESCAQKFKEFNAENLNFLCNELEKKVPWQRQIIPEIAGTVLQSRSGMLRRESNVKTCHKQETWLFFLGQDLVAKEIIAQELARIVFGSYSKLVSIRRTGSLTPPGKDHHGRKRERGERSCGGGYVERLAEAVSVDPHRVFVIEDLDAAGYGDRMGVKRAIETGMISVNGGGEVGFCDAIVVLSCDKLRSVSDFSLDLNISFYDGSFDDLGILENVDKHVMFQLQENCPL